MVSVDKATVDLSPERLARYDTRAPRYTSYPTAPQWTDAFGAAEYAQALRTRPAEAPVSLYVHVPFCLERCRFCGCNVVISKKPAIANDYLDWVEQEATILATSVSGRLQIQQLHWGGGTPNYLAPEQMRRLHGIIADRFDIIDGAEVALELDPRHATREQIDTLADLGFNRASMGIQDTTDEVQQAINRVQSRECSQQAIDWLRAAGFGGINVDIIYGLPFQTEETWSQTLEAMADFQPDRVAMYGFAFLPEKLRNQNRMDESALPGSRERLDLFLRGLQWFESHGYRHIGMDHFARETDELALAWREQTLRRNFMGYTTRAGTDLVGLGLSSISDVGGCFAQNEKHYASYGRRVGAGRLPVVRGLALDADDLVRRAVIERLMCFGVLDMTAIAAEFDISFADYFRDELEALAPMAADGLIAIEPGAIRTTKLGQILLRNVAAVFDRYLKRREAAGTQETYSRTI